jgi:hypothetical protein
VTDLIASHSERRPGEQAFLVEQSANWVTPPHYHLEHQFQVVTGGHGRIGRHEVGPLSVHYAAPQTAYGPVEAGPDGLSYLNFRLSGDTGAWYLHKPGSRERMQRGLKREQVHGGPSNRLSADALASLTQTSVEALIEPRADGLAAYLLHIAPRQAHLLTTAIAHGGRFCAITRGAVEIADATMKSLAVAFSSADEQLSLRAGDAGAEVLVLQFPAQAMATPSQPGASAVSPC